MRVMVSGATGCLGRQLLMDLPAAGHSVLALVRRRHGEISCEQLLYEFPNIPAQLPSCDAFVHTAAITPATGSEFSLNEKMTAQALQMGKAAGAKIFVHISSCAVMGDLYEGERDEAVPCRPDSVYGQSKLDCETLVQKFCAEHGMVYVILRPGLIYGPHDRGAMKKIIDMIRRGYFVQLGDGKNCKSLTSVEWLAAVIVRCLAQPSTYKQIYIVVDPVQKSLRELIALVRAEVNPRAVVLPVPAWFVRLSAWGLEKLESLGLRLSVRGLDLRKFLVSNTYSPRKIMGVVGESNFSLEQTLRREAEWVASL